MKQIASITFFLTGLLLYAQVGINTTDPKGTLDIVGVANSLTTIDGVIAPRLTRAQLTAKGNTLYGTNQTGAIVYISDISGGDTVSQRINITQVGYYYFDGSLWQFIQGDDWHTTGNTGTSSTTNFIGTKDAQDLIFKMNNVNSGRINTFNTYFGYDGPTTVGNFAYNTAFGNSALKSITTGTLNTAIGRSALGALTTATSNTAVGANALGSLQTGLGRNVAIGLGALASTTTGVENVAVGTNALNANTTTNGQNTAIGYLSLGSSITGTNNTGLGYQAGQQNTAGSNNVYVGGLSGGNNTSGSNNIFIGYLAGYKPTPTAIGGGNILIGTVNLPNDAGNDQLNIGNLIYGTGMSATSNSSTPSASGRVGIGTNSPQTAFHVVGTIRNPTVLTNAYANTDSFVTADATTGDLKSTPFIPVKIGSELSLNGTTNMSAFTPSQLADFYFVDKTHTLTLPTPSASFTGKLVRFYLFGGNPPNFIVNGVSTADMSATGTLPAGVTKPTGSNVLTITGNNMRFQFIDFICSGTEWWPSIID
ncbi:MULTISPECIES: hypothetical protein [unclassified Chryseobacterium]|uniref:hypothetical protein n=1 Tax=unclassified Chryseobacterium TaxID=2593645 RepID=UPI000D3999AB|nr:MULTISPECIES: hypothetical protein [unclassified Chryseobacterium]PTT74560.1 hypothetical protein DBR25_10540 [Chryseobacterium sp. HMWF001]PVV51666.1 hypothetical protein DD829_20260 [Chryseobacterium sp. HMWF035]